MEMDGNDRQPVFQKMDRYGGIDTSREQGDGFVHDWEREAGFIRFIVNDQKSTSNHSDQRLLN